MMLEISFFDYHFFISHYLFLKFVVCRYTGSNRASSSVVIPTGVPRQPFLRTPSIFQRVESLAVSDSRSSAPLEAGTPAAGQQRTPSIFRSVESLATCERRPSRPWKKDVMINYPSKTVGENFVGVQNFVSNDVFALTSY